MRPELYLDAEIITKSDSDVVTGVTGFMVGVAGNIRVRMTKSQRDVVLPVIAGVVYPLQIDMIFSTNTTATGLIALR